MRAVGMLMSCGATALIAFDDLLAQGVMAGLATIGIRVPKDMSVIGCDNLVASRTYPPLTSIESGASQTGTLAVDLLLQQAEKETRIVTDSYLVVRSTTGERILSGEPGV